MPDRRRWRIARIRVPEIGHSAVMLLNLVKRYVLLAVAVPLAAAGARKLSDVIEARRGPSRGTRLLRQGADTIQGRFGRRPKQRRFGFGR
jgi:hypothetical protein